MKDFRLSESFKRRRNFVQQYLATLAARDSPTSSTYEVDSGHECNGFIKFKSKEEMFRYTDSENTAHLTEPDPLAELPELPSIPEAEFLRVQKAIQKKSPQETLEEYYAAAKIRREIDDKEAELGAENLSDGDNDDDNDDGDGNDGDGQSSHLPCEDESSQEKRDNKRDMKLAEEATAASDTNRSALTLLEDTLISGFHPNSCSTSIGHQSLNFSRMNDFDDVQNPLSDSKAAVNQTIVPNYSPQSSSSDRTTFRERSTLRPEASKSHQSPELSKGSQLAPGTDVTPSSMMKRCNLGSSTPVSFRAETPSEETPIARRLRQLGLLNDTNDDTSFVSRTPSSKRRRLTDSERCVQVYATPRRRSLEELLLPTVNLSDLISVRVVEKNPYITQTPSSSSRFNKRF